jgi:exodeoxyribonuclease-3
MRIVTLNANGIRSAARKGFFTWMKSCKPDLVCIQETKAQIGQLADVEFFPTGYHCYYHDAARKGYSGVAIYTRNAPLSVHYGLGWHDVDAEGRYLEVRFEKLRVISLYVQSGTSGEERQAVKYRFMDRFMPYLESLHETGCECVICGDWNIAHRKIDLKNWRGNQKNSGFLPEERAWMDRLFGHAGFVDAFRVANQESDQYTWWSNRGQARAKNVGWRIDYQVITPGLADKVRSVAIYTDERFSDHAPLTIEYDHALANASA